MEDAVDLVGIGFRNSRDELEQFFVPVLFPEQKDRVGVLDVTPDLAELGEVFDLRFAVPGRLLRQPPDARAEDLRLSYRQ